MARHFAPVLYQETDDPYKDLFTAFDFDGNWNGDDNSENMQCYGNPGLCDGVDNPNSTCANQACPLVATIYYTVIETDTHWFIQYMPYHPLDWKPSTGHEHDTESLLVTVRKDPRSIDVVETRWHNEWKTVAA